MHEAYDEASPTSLPLFISYLTFMLLTTRASHALNWDFVRVSGLLNSEGWRAVQNDTNDDSFEVAFNNAF